MKHIITLLTCLGCCAPVVRADNAIEPWRALDYGMFIHFGMSTFIGNEYGSGKEDAATYAPTHLDVDQWIRVAKDAGMKYAVLTSKHVAGHCLWDSQVQFRGKEFDHDIRTSGNQTDVVAAFVKACQKYGLMPGLYWCLQDHRNNSKPLKQQRTAPLPDDFFQLAQDQLTELTRLYPAVNYYWLDIPVAASPAQRVALYDLIKRQRPGTIVLFNHGAAKPKGPLTVAGCQSAWPTDVLNTERQPLQPGWFKPEQTWQGKTYQLGYEHCDTICKKWFWVEGDRPRPVSELAQLYWDTHAAGGNLLLNVPPDRTGRIPEYHVKALMELKEEIQ
ncbi:MAG: alpha-L-fucosidase [Akkermansiaceae bacterium]|jgi:alpha-L-fucosidase|nr:alpha-L-fucosidase [Akkermansiaceae bacterium]